MPLAGGADDASGERFLLDAGMSLETTLEHLHRYVAAAQLVQGKGAVLDIACGVGYGAYILSQSAERVIGVDVSPDAIASARRAYEATSNLTFQEGSCADIPLGDASVDAIVSFETLEHIVEHDAFLKEIRRVLKPGGLLIMSTPDRVVYNATLAEPNPFHLKELTQDEFRRLLEPYFGNVSLSAQRVLTASVLSGLDARGPEDIAFISQRDAGDEIEIDDTLAEGVYLIALCSDGPLPRLPAGLFEGVRTHNLISSLQGGVAERDSRLLKQLEDIGQLRAEAARLEQSLEVAGARIAEQQAQVRRAEADCEAWEARLAEQQAQVRRIEAEHEALETRIAEQQLRLNQADAERTALEARIVEQKARLSQAEIQASAMIAPLRAKLGAAEEARLLLEQEMNRLRTRFARRQIVRRVGRILARRGGVLRDIAIVFGLYQPSLLLSPRTAMAVRRQVRTIAGSSLFDSAYYRARYSDVGAMGEDPLLHYVLAGARELRDPSPHFSTAGYLEDHADVAASGVNPLYHYLAHGRHEGRVAPPALQPPVEDAGETILEPGHPGFDPAQLYSLRPDASVGAEARKGEWYMDRFALRGPRPDFRDATAALTTLPEGLNIAGLGAGRNTPPDVSIIIPVYGQLAYTLNCLQSLRQHVSRYVCEIIVVDDCSPDDTARRLPEVPWVRYIRQAENGGFIAACNCGAAEARGRFLVFLNNDTRVVPGWLDELIGSFDVFPEAGLVGSKLFYADGTLQEAGGIIWRDGSGWNYGRNDDPNKPEYCYARQVDYCSGASIAVPRRVWETVGGFDGDYYERAYCEDSDLAFRIREAGLQTWFQPLSRVIHYEGKTSGTDTRTGEKAYQVSNQRRFVERWRTVLESHGEPGVDPLGESDRRRPRYAAVFDATTPTPDQDAGSLTAISYLEMLARRGYRVVFTPQHNFLYLGRYASDLQRRGVMVMYSPFVRDVEGVLDMIRDRTDVIQIFRYNVALNVIGPARRMHPSAPVVFHNSDLHFVRLERKAKLTGDFRTLRTAQKVKKDELKVIRAVDCTIVHTPVERDLLTQAVAGAAVRVLPHVYPVYGTTVPYEARKDFLFIGGYGHPPNVDAVEWFVAECWPALRQACPGAHLWLVGAAPTEDVRALACDDITVTGRVDDLRPYFDRARVFVAPLRYGAGLKAKLATAMSFGVPSVATAVAIEGMDLVDGEHVLTADTPEALIAASRRLYEDPDLWARLSRAGQTFVEAHYSTAVADATFAEILATATRVRQGAAGGDGQ